MAGRRYLTPGLTFDRSAILRGAWAKARAIARSLGTAPAPFRKITTARAEFADCLQQVWNTAKSERALAIWSAEQQAGATVEAARRNALPVRARAIEDATTILTHAEHAENFTAAGNVALSTARAQLVALHNAA